MARVEIATLCNAVTYRDGLISILEGGVEHYPSGVPIEVVAVLWLRAEPEEAGEGYPGTAEIVRNDTILAGQHLEVRFPVPTDEDFMPHFVEIVRWPGVTLEPGIYRCRMTLRGSVIADMPFFVRPPSDARPG